MKNIGLHIINAIMIAISTYFIVYSIIQAVTIDASSVTQQLLLYGMTLAISVYEVVMFIKKRSYSFYGLMIVLKHVPNMLLMFVVTMIFLGWGDFSQLGQFAMYFATLLFVLTLVVGEVILKKMIEKSRTSEVNQ